jgi:hypothetical protein
MDEEEIIRLADNNRSLISACSDPAAGMQAVIQEHELVYGIFPSSAVEAGWEKVCIKGVEGTGATTTAVWCASLEEAMALSRIFGAPSNI